MPHKNRGISEAKRKKVPDMFGQSRCLAGSAIHAVIKCAICSF